MESRNNGRKNEREGYAVRVLGTGHVYLSDGAGGGP